MTNVFTKTKNVIHKEKVRFGKRPKKHSKIAGTVRTVCMCESFNLAEIGRYFRTKGGRGTVVKEMADLVWIETDCDSTMSKFGLARKNDARVPQRVPKLDPDHHVIIENPPETTHETYEFFFFSYGVLVWWSTHPPVDDWSKGGKAFLRLMELNRLVFEVNSRPNIEPETCQWSIDKNMETIDCDVFTLPDTDPIRMLACSHGLAQSIKLAEFESRVEEMINTTKEYPNVMDPDSVIPLPKMKEVCMKQGELFLNRMDINLHTDILDTPEFFWTHTDLEPLYLRTRRYMEITNRADVLNKRLEIVQELYSVLFDEIQTRTATSLELYIIWLLLLDFIMSLVSFLAEFYKRKRK
eukprot:TRINITY_DN28229_c0_g1_i1.p1 TRINITY_DN28229_c0_g1~~TRINITY_DN28229_c0_g1_i1.p1  ORF type:complete len:353 (+),score=49.96 TRINITY_DN28229_c0_g1_i1:48-1106(+)